MKLFILEKPKLTKALIEGFEDNVCKRRKDPYFWRYSSFLECKQTYPDTTGKSIHKKKEQA